MQRLVLFGIFAGCLSALSAAPSEEPVSIKNVVVQQAPGKFYGWPANNGMWCWGNEILVGFMEGTFKKSLFGHAIDEAQPITTMFARSMDGGETWQPETPGFLNAQGGEPALTDCPGGVDFEQPEFIMTLRMVNSQEGFSRFYYSTDRGHAWSGPFRLPEFGRKTVSARTDYCVLGRHDLIAFITGAKDNGEEGRAFATRTTDGGGVWNFVSWIVPEPKEFAVMPSTVRLGPASFLTAIRCQDGEDGWIDLYRSDDTGRTWTFLNRPAEHMGGNPPAMIKLADGRIALHYGYREAPYGLRARVSVDQGQTWGAELVLRADAGCWDLGYPRAVQRADGKVVTVYYYNDHRDTERYIAATIWDAGTTGAPPAPK